MNGRENEIIPHPKIDRLNKEPEGPQFNTPFIYDDILDTSSIENVLLIHDEIGNYKSLYDNCNTSTLAIVYSVRSNSDDLNTLLKSKFSKINRLAIAFHDPGANQYKTFLNYAWLFTPDDLKEDIKGLMICNISEIKIGFLTREVLDNYNSKAEELGFIEKMSIF